MSIPHVSLLLPARDGAATLKQALDSIAAQSFGDFEIILVDDGSVDNSVALAREGWRGPQPLHVLQPGQVGNGVGIANALQTGLHACRGELVARMDADDIALPERLAKQVALLRARPEVDIAGCLVESFAGAPGSETTIAEGYRLYDQWINQLIKHDDIQREMFVESPFAHPSVIFRRRAIEQLGGYRDIGWPEDYDLWLRAAAAGLRFAKVDEILLRWRDHAGRASRVQPIYTREAFVRCKAHYLAQGAAAGRSIVVWGGGGVGRLLGKFLQAEGADLTAFVDIDPRKVGGQRRGVPVVFPDRLPGLRPCLLLAAVGSRGARDLIRNAAGGFGFVEGEDFLCAA